MQKNQTIPIFPMPMRGILLLTGMYTVAWSAFFKYLGEHLLRWLSMTPENIPGLESNWFGGFGLLIGFLIFMSAFYPSSWRYLILVGIVGKIISVSWFFLDFIPILGINKRTIFHLAFNELLWLIPLTIIYLRAIKVHTYLKTLPEEK